jgi:hypothetical protein
MAVDFATAVLWSLTGQRFGVCAVTLRPCRRDCFDGRFFDDFGPPWSGGQSYPQPALVGGQWFNLTCGSCHGGCSCNAVSEVLLPAPVHRIVEVQVDGTPMATGSYRVDNNRLLIRTDGGTWPRCNDLALDDTEEGTWSVTVEVGEPPPEGAALAMGQLACSVLQAIGNGGECPLPPGVQQLIRQGVTIQYPDIGELFRDGRTGLYLVDAFIATWNPGRLRNRSRVYRVDQPTVRRAGT